MSAAPLLLVIEGPKIYEVDLMLRYDDSSQNYR